MNNKTQNIFTLPTNIAFVDGLAEGLLGYAENHNILLSQIHIYLPTRRACRALRQSFLVISNGKPLMLPFMHVIGDIDEDELSLKIPHSDIADIPPAITPLKRQLLLARIIQARPDMKDNPDQAMQLAQALGTFMDQIIIAGLSLSDLHKIVPEEFAEHWQITLDFLKILSEHWPQILADHNVIDSADRRNTLMHCLCEHWKTSKPNDHIIVAGSTGTVPATAALMRAALNLPNGSVILPGLDSDIDEDSWQVLEPQHPQNSLKNFLTSIDIIPSQIVNWPYCKTSDSDIYTARRLLFREIMRPAQTSSQWQNLRANQIKPALNDFHVMNFDTNQDEALGIALLMRQSLETEGQTAALVTPDRILAQRVSAICRKWEIDVDDSGGQMLLSSLRGQFMALILEAVQNNYRPVALLSLLKHGLCKIGYDANDYFKHVQGIDKTYLRGNVAYKHLSDLIERDHEKDKHGRESYHEFLTRIEDSLSALIHMRDGGKHNFSQYLETHLNVAEALSATQRDGIHQSGAEMLWKGEDGENAALLFAELYETSHILPALTFDEYVSILTGLMQNMRVRAAYGTHPRLMILGQMEARLIQADVMILSGLNEGVWPPDTGHDPWMSRPMRKEYGLPSADMRIGLAAHDFGQCFCAKKIYLTRSIRQDNAPGVPSRWIQRLNTLLSGIDIDPSTLSDNYLSALMKHLKQTTVTPAPFLRPAPTPPVSARPKELPVTAIENWMRDPYAVYARYVLNLRKLRDLEEDMDAALRGTLIHDVFERFTVTYPDIIPDNAHDILIDYVRDALGSKTEEPGFWSFWEPRFERIIDWFIAHEVEWRTQAKPLASEIKGTYLFHDLNFTLTAKADRIDRMKDGGLAIIDYKTGQPPTPKAVKDGLSPQLPLEGLIAQNAGFKNGDSAERISYMGFWRLSGGSQAGEESPLKTAEIEDLIASSYEGVHSLIARFNDETLPYYSLPDSTRTPRIEFQDYAHLARVQEWAALDDQENAA